MISSARSARKKHVVESFASASECVGTAVRDRALKKLQSLRGVITDGLW